MPNQVLVFKDQESTQKATELERLPPTTECFVKNVKRGHLQVMVCYSTMSPTSPPVDVSLFGWQRGAKTLRPADIPDSVEAAPPSILQCIKCTCASDNACSSTRCSCHAAGISCTILCKCFGGNSACFNPKNLNQENDTSDEDKNSKSGD